MSTATELVQRLYAAMAASDTATIIECIAPDAEVRHPGAPPARGGEELAKLISQQMSAFSSPEFDIQCMIDAGDTVVVEHTFRATHTGALPGPSGPLRPTGKQIGLESCDVISFQDGRVKTFHVYLDTMSLLGQLGLMSAPVRA